MSTTPPSILPATWTIPQVFRDRIGATAGRQRLIEDGGQLLLVLHEPPQLEETERRPRLFWCNEQGDWHDSQGRPGIQGLREHLKNFEDVINECEAIESKATKSDEYFDVLSRLAPIHRAAQNLYQVMQDARAATSDKQILNLRDQAYQIARTAELLYTGTKTELDFIVAKRAEEQARASHQMAISAHRLNMLAAFFFPIATLSTIFGMNVNETLNPLWAFLTLIGVGMLMGSALVVVTTPRKK